MLTLPAAIAADCCSSKQEYGENGTSGSVRFMVHHCSWWFHPLPQHHYCPIQRWEVGGRGCSMLWESRNLTLPTVSSSRQFFLTTASYSVPVSRRG